MWNRVQRRFFSLSAKKLQSKAPLFGRKEVGHRRAQCGRHRAMKRSDLPTKRIAFPTQVSEPASEKQKSDLFYGSLVFASLRKPLIYKEKFWWCSSPLEETALPHRQGHHRRDCTPCGSPGRVLPSPHISATAERETTSALRWVACVFRPLVPEHESRCTPQGTAKLLPTSTATRSPHHPSIRDRPTRKLAKVSTEV